jgi:acyl-CoA synthetase (AMP-forming)/AMP-acid ligase II
VLVSDIVRRNAIYFADHDALVVPAGETISWGELDERTDRFARALADLGLGKGDRLAIYAPNCATYVEFFLACAKSGVIGASLNIRLSPGELRSYLAYVEPAAMLVHASLDDAAEVLLDGLESPPRVIGFGGEHGRELDLEQACAAQVPGSPAVAIAETDVYQLGATSGTTGVPKGALLTHRNAVGAMLNWLADMPMQERGTNLQNIPYFFNPGGPAGLHPVLMKGGRTVVPSAFEPGQFLRLVPEYGVSQTIIVPTMVQMIIEHPEAEDHDLSSLESILSGGSPFHRATLRRAREIMGDVFFPWYGMAETYSCGAVLRRENQITEGTDEEVARLSSIGKPQALMQMRVVDLDGNDVERDGVASGEIWLQGDSVSPGYFRMPEETEASRQDGWFKTGDVATVDAEGFVTIVDRMKDIIITGGINVFSRDIEEALIAHPAVSQVAVIGIPHETWGESVHAVVTLTAGQQADEAELIDFAAGRLAAYKKPRSLEIRDALPVSGTGKILKRELRQPFWAGHGS